jgi:hypothetical protein
MGAYQRDTEAALRDFAACYNNERYRELTLFPDSGHPGYAAQAPLL